MAYISHKKCKHDRNEQMNEFILEMNETCLVHVTVKVHVEQCYFRMIMAPKIFCTLYLCIETVSSFLPALLPCFCSGGGVALDVYYMF